MAFYITRCLRVGISLIMGRCYAGEWWLCSQLFSLWSVSSKCTPSCNKNVSGRIESCISCLPRQVAAASRQSHCIFIFIFRASAGWWNSIVDWHMLRPFSPNFPRPLANLRNKQFWYFPRRNMPSFGRLVPMYDVIVIPLTPFFWCIAVVTAEPSHANWDIYRPCGTVNRVFPIVTSR